MGYTHYFGANKNFTDEQWEALCAKTRTIVDHCTAQGIVLLEDGYDADDDTPARIAADSIRFNGDSRTNADLGHEPFIVYKEGLSEGFSFCKTAWKPYDLAVALVLLAAHDVAPGVLNIGSDGDWDKHNEQLGGSWVTPRAVYQVLFGTEPCWVKEREA